MVAGAQAKVTLGLLALIFVTNQWSRYAIVYLGGVAVSECGNEAEGDACYFKENERELPLCPTYKCKNFIEPCERCQKCYAAHHAAKRNLQYGTCLTSANYGILVSFGYTIPFSITNLFAGRIADLYNRKAIVLMALAGWALATGVQGLADDYVALLFSRVFMGVALALSSPASYSMIADLFPPEKRSTANAIYGMGVYVGGGLSSICLVIGNAIGWRDTSFAIAAVEAVLAVGLCLLVHEPKRGRTAPAEDGYEELVDESEPETPMSWAQVATVVASDKAVVLLFIAVALRYVGGFAIGTFLPLFFKRKFPEQNALYGTVNAFVVSIGGATSAYAGGQAADRLGKVDERALAWIPALGFFLGYLPFFGILYADNFYVAMGCLFVEYLLAECFFGPAIAIIQNRIDAKARGVTISIYFLVASMVGSFAPVILGKLDDGETVHSLQQNLIIIVGISYVGSSVLFVVLGFLLK